MQKTNWYEVQLGRPLGKEDFCSAHVNKAESYLRKALEIDPKNDYTLTLLGNVLKCKEKYDAAEEHLRKAIEISPEYAFALTRLGNILMRKEKFSEAAKFLRKAVEINPDSDSANEWLAEIDRLQTEYFGSNSR